MRIFPPHATDFYKTGHIFQYPKGTEYVYSNFTCRSDKWAKVLPDFDHKVVFFGLAGLCQSLLIEDWNDGFFNRYKSEVLEKYKRRMDAALGEGVVPVDHIAALHDLGYLPVLVKSLPEGSRVDIRVPLFTIVNTRPEFYWITNYLETQISAELMKMVNSATTAFEYRRLFERYAALTGCAEDGFVPFQGHDFSMRGMSGVADATQSGAAHLTSFLGTDTISAIDYLEDYYKGLDVPFIGGSVPATEHSVMCMGGEADEFDTFRRLVTEVYPKGIVSIVSDTWDFWQVMTDFVQRLRYVILDREGKVVFRPDSGDPEKIIVGYTYTEHAASTSMDDRLWDAYHDELTCVKDADGRFYALELGHWPNGDPIPKRGRELSPPEVKGAAQCLWDAFGGTYTVAGYKSLDHHVGLIYGDSITLDVARRILEGLLKKGFASDCIVLGIGSFTYNYVTRDTYGMAIKATHGVVNGEARDLCKNPKTDSGVKKSAKGLLRVEYEDGRHVLYDEQTPEQERGGLLQPLLRDGRMERVESLADVRARLEAELHG